MGILIVGVYGQMRGIFFYIKLEMENVFLGFKVVVEWIGNRWNDVMNVSLILILLLCIFYVVLIGCFQFWDFVQFFCFVLLFCLSVCESCRDFLSLKCLKMIQMQLNQIFMDVICVCLNCCGENFCNQLCLNQFSCNLVVCMFNDVIVKFVLLG